MSDDRRPDYYLQVKDRGTSGVTNAGAAWVNSKGGITIRLNPAIVLAAKDLGNTYITLWPNEEKSASTPAPRGGALRFHEPPTGPDLPPPPSAPPYVDSNPLDDDIPF